MLWRDTIDGTLRIDDALAFESAWCYGETRQKGGRVTTGQHILRNGASSPFPFSLYSNSDIIVESGTGYPLSYFYQDGQSLQGASCIELALRRLW